MMNSFAHEWHSPPLSLDLFLETLFFWLFDTRSWRDVW